MHREAFAFVAESVKALPQRQRVLEIGSRNVNGSIRPLFLRVGGWFHGIDVAPGPGVDEVADGASFRTPEAPDTIVCCEVLEHAAQAPAIVRNIFEQLAPGGVAILTMAGTGRQPHSAEDGGPVRQGEYYHNVESGELADWCAGFEHVKIQHDPYRGDLYCLATKGNE